METAAAVILMLLSCDQDGRACVELLWERAHFASLETCEAKIPSAIARLSLPDNNILARCDDSRIKPTQVMVSREGTKTVRVSRFAGNNLVVENFEVPAIRPNSRSRSSLR